MLILCDGRLAEKPYKMPVTRQNIYSLEELCYYIYHNIYTITEEFFQESLADWLRASGSGQEGSQYAWL